MSDIIIGLLIFIAGIIVGVVGFILTIIIIGLMAAA